MEISGGIFFGSDVENKNYNFMKNVLSKLPDKEKITFLNEQLDSIVSQKKCGLLLASDPGWNLSLDILSVIIFTFF